MIKQEYTKNKHWCKNIGYQQVAKNVSISNKMTYLGQTVVRQHLLCSAVRSLQTPLTLNLWPALSALTDIFTLMKGLLHYT